jgi:ribosomal protein S18 acetylase RimI-like enzyme
VRLERDSAPPGRVLAAGPADRDTLIETLAEAFDADPILAWMLRDDQGRPAALRRFFAYILDAHGFPFGEVLATAGYQACAVWAPSGRAALSTWEKLRLLPDMLRVSSAARLPRLLATADLFARHMPAEPHLYLYYIGVRPERRGQGLGAALMAAAIARLDREGRAAYLENSNPRNRPLYERFGFRVTAELACPYGGPRFWPMWREARQPAG